MTISLPYDLTDSQWQSVTKVFREIADYDDSSPYALWQGEFCGIPYKVDGSVEPGGFLLTSDLDSRTWAGWISVLCAKLSLALGIEVRDAEM